MLQLPPRSPLHHGGRTPLDGAGPLGVAVRLRILPHYLLNLPHMGEMESEGDLSLNGHLWAL